MRGAIYAVIGVFVVLLSGCASVPMASTQLDASAKNFSTQPDKGTVYIYRNETFGAAIPITVSVNGKTLGQTAAKTYFYLSLAPGKYSINSLGEDVSTLDLNVEGGKSYFVWQEIKMGMWSPRTRLQEMDETKGRTDVLECKMIAPLVADSELSATVMNDKAPTVSSEEQTATVSEKLRELQGLRKDGVISEPEYEKKKSQLLKSF